jgi:hypothetical protein
MRVHTVKMTELSENVRVSTVCIEHLDPGPYETMAFAPWFEADDTQIRNNSEDAALASHEAMVMILKEQYSKYVSAVTIRATAQAAGEISSALAADDIGLAIDRANVNLNSQTRIKREQPYDPRLDALTPGPRKIRLEKQ